MKTQASKVLTNWLNEEFKKHNIPYKAVYTEMTEREYDLKVGDSSMDTLELDFNFAKNKYRVIKILYPDSYYTMLTYLTTSILIDLAENINRDADKYYENIFNYVEV